MHVKRRDINQWQNSNNFQYNQAYVIGISNIPDVAFVFIGFNLSLLYSYYRHPLCKRGSQYHISINSSINAILRILTKSTQIHTSIKLERGLSKNINEVGNIFKSSFYSVYPLIHCGPDKIDAILQTTFSNAFSWMKMCSLWLRFHWSLFPRVKLTIFQHWFR